MTRYSPLCNWGVNSGGKRVGIIGIGGLGQMGVRCVELASLFNLMLLKYLKLLPCPFWVPGLWILNFWSIVHIITLTQVRLAKAMGNTVTAISTSPSKEPAAREIGADKWVLSSEKICKTKKANKDEKIFWRTQMKFYQLFETFKLIIIALRNSPLCMKCIGLPDNVSLCSFVVSTNPESMKSAALSLDLILNTVSAKHQVRIPSIEQKT